METTISLPLHLHEALLPLISIETIPSELKDNLEKYVKPKFSESATQIPYSLLRETSKWADSEEGKSQITKLSLNFSDYSMIALLAGTVTSPAAKLAPYKRSPSPEEKAIIRSKERKAISALINGVLSVIGVGVAAWWASNSSGWKRENRVLLAVLAAMVVAAAEGILYWIWQWRYDQALKGRQFKAKSLRKKSETDLPLDNDAKSGPILPEGLRLRQPGAPEEQKD